MLDRHRCVLEGRSDVCSSTDRIGEKIVLLWLVSALSRFRLLGKDRSSDERLLGFLLLLQRLLLVCLGRIVLLRDEVLVLVLNEHDAT